MGLAASAVNPGGMEVCTGVGVSATYRRPTSRTWGGGNLTFLPRYTAVLEPLTISYISWSRI